MLTLRSDISVLLNFPAALSQYEFEVSRNVDELVEAVELFGLDGVDIVMDRCCGSTHMTCGDQSSVNLHFLELLREGLPDKAIIEEKHA